MQKSLLVRKPRHRLNLGRLGLDERVVALAAHVGLEILVAELAQLLDTVDTKLLRLADDGDSDLDRDLTNLRFENGSGGGRARWMRNREGDARAQCPGTGDSARARRA